MAPERNLSPLELTALGVILKRAPCVAHTVIAEFAGSQTLAYRSGAGSIYPLLKRLTKRGLLSLDGRQYSVTEAGRAALREWILPPFEPADFSANLDVLRSRVYFLKLLSPTEIERFADAALEGLGALRDQCLQTLEGYQASGDGFSEIAMLGAVRETEARIGWIRELRRRFAAARE